MAVAGSSLHGKPDKNRNVCRENAVSSRRRSSISRSLGGNPAMIGKRSAMVGIVATLCMAGLAVETGSFTAYWRQFKAALSGSTPQPTLGEQLASDALADKLQSLIHYFNGVDAPLRVQYGKYRDAYAAALNPSFQ